MDKNRKLLEYVLLRKGDANVAFSGLRGLLKGLGFDERIRGDHHIFTKEGIEEILNLQPIAGKAKAYQVRQVRNVILDHRLDLED